MDRATQNSIGDKVSYSDPKKAPERRSWLRPFERELPERLSATKNTPAFIYLTRHLISVTCYVWLVASVMYKDNTLLQLQLNLFTV
jgi:hypothetical protein